MKTNVYRSGLYARLRKSFFSEFIEAILVAALVAVLLRVFIVSVYRVPTESMMPTLIPGDFIVAWKTSYGVPIPFSEDRIGRRDPARGDVVIFYVPSEDTMFIKRVVGVPGDRIEIRDGALSINDVVVTATADAATASTESADGRITTEVIDGSTHRVMTRGASAEADFLAPMVVPPGHVFLLGDFRSDSYDSRQWGPVPMQQIVGRAAFIGISLQIAGSTIGNRFERIFNAIK